MDRVITVDGFASSGKSTLSRLLAKKLDWPWFSTGVLYRGMAYVERERNLQRTEILKFVHSDHWKIHLGGEKTQFFYQGVNVTDQLYMSSIDERASLLSAWTEFRKALIPFQRAFLSKDEEGKGLVAEGRDCGTRIFPSAPLKVFLQAGEEVRAKRRSRDRARDQLEISTAFKAQRERDRRDRERDFAPTAIPSGSLVLDSGKNSPEELVQQVYEEVCRIFSF